MDADGAWEDDFGPSQGSAADAVSEAASPSKKSKKVRKSNLKKASPKKKAGKVDKIDRSCFICPTKKK